MYYLKSKRLSYGMNIPTTLNEIAPEILTSLTKDVIVAPHYAIVALAFKTSLFEFAISINNNKKDNVKIVPIIAKTDSDLYKVGDRPIVASSGIELAHHVAIPTCISTNAVHGYFIRDEQLTKDSNIIGAANLRTECTKKQYTGNLTAIGITDTTPSMIESDNKVSIYLLEFKIIPLNSIVGVMPGDFRLDDPFIVNDKSTLA